MFLRLAFKNVISRKSSFIIVLFISFAIMLLVVTNAVFDSTENGVKQSFVNSFTGDIAIRPLSKSPLSLFGDETPVTGTLTKNECLVPFEEIASFIESQDDIVSFVPQVSGAAVMEKDSSRVPTMLFGVDGKKYSESMPAIRIVDGVPFSSGAKGLMLTTKKAAQIGAKVGDTVQFSVADGISFRIRACPLSAVYEYEIDNAVLDKIAIIDDETLRSLMDLTSSSSSDSVVMSDEAEEVFSDELDDDFFTTDDGDAVIRDFSESEIVSSADSSREISTSWNFIVLKLSEKSDANGKIRMLNRHFKKSGWNVEAVNWRNAAGSTALYLYWMRMILNVGILIVLAVGFIVVNNTLEINVLERVAEIGTLRAIGATKRFVSLECMAETLIMTVASGVFGSMLGILAGKIICNLNIVFSNQFLVQLFGDSQFLIAVSFRNVEEALLFSVLLGFLVWIYPVVVSLKTSPVRAMSGGK